MAVAVPLVLGALGLGYLFSSNESTEPLPAPAAPITPAKPNPVYERAAENAVVGRYDNLPILQSVYKDAAYQLDPGVVGRMNYDGSQGSLLEPNVTPLSLGILPQMNRSTGVMLPDPISGDDLKPQKRENRDVDMFMPMGQELKNRYTPVHLQAEMRIQQLEAKQQRGHGGLDDFTHIPDLPCAREDATRNFARGEVMTIREGGFHPRTRIFRVPETFRGRNQHSFRLGNPTYATGKLDSIYQTESAPLGEMEHNHNADVEEWFRPPERGGGAKHGPEGRSLVPMGSVNRDSGPCLDEIIRQSAARSTSYDPNDVFTACEGSTEKCWAGPGGREGIAQEARRILNRYVRPKYQTGAIVVGPEDAPRGVARGAYEVSDYKQDLCDQAPQRTTMEDCVMKQPAPYNPRGNYTSYYEDQRHRQTVRCVDGRPGPAMRAVNEVADSGGGPRFYDVIPRDATNKKVGELQEQIHAPNSTRSLAAQRPEEFYAPVSRRVTPFITQDLAFQEREPYINNPYAQPLPHVPAQQTRY